MQLLMLPQEVILHIMEYLGSDYFQRDLDRLLISKIWFEAAQSTMVKDLTVSTALLERLIKATEGGRPPYSLGQHLQSVNMLFSGYSGVPKPRKRRTLNHIRNGENQQFVERLQDNMDDYPWTHIFNQELVGLGGLLAQCDGFKSLRMEAREEQPNRRTHTYSRPYLFRSALILLLDIDSLQDLSLDLHGSDVIEDENLGGKAHFCTQLRDLFPRLKRFECRMTTICPELLHVEVAEEKMQLEVVIINLSLATSHSQDIPYRFPARCNAGRRRSFGQLRDDMEGQAEVLCDLMKRPKMVRVISHGAATLQHQTFDAMTKTRHEFNPSGLWWEKGKLIDEEY